MPEKHHFYAGLDKEYFENWAKKIDPSVYTVIVGIFDSRRVEQQGYRTCIGLQSLHRKDPQSFIEAC